MAQRTGAADIGNVTPPRTPLVPFQRTASDVIDLHVVRMGGERAMAAAAAAPVRHLPATLLDALQGSWGTPEELGLTRLAHLRVVAG
jgi:hypothetical protein